MMPVRKPEKWPGEAHAEHVLDLAYLIHRAQQLGIPPEQMEGWPNGKAPARKAGEPREGQAGSTPAPSASDTKMVSRNLSAAQVEALRSKFANIQNPKVIEELWHVLFDSARNVTVLPLMQRSDEEMETARLKLHKAEQELMRMHAALAEGKLHQPQCTATGMVGDNDCRCAVGLKMRNLRRIAKVAGTERLSGNDSAGDAKQQQEPFPPPQIPPATPKEQRMDTKVAELMERAVMGGMEDFQWLLMEAWNDGHAAGQGITLNEHLLRLIDKFGSGRAVAKAVGFDHTYVSLLLKGREPTEETAAKLGLVKEVRYFPKESAA